MTPEQTSPWFDPEERRLDLFEQFRAEKLIFDPTIPEDLETLRLDAERIARGMDDPGDPPPMLWSGVPVPEPVSQASCDYHLVISVGGTKTEFALLRLEDGALHGLDLLCGAEVSTPEEISRVKDAVKMATPAAGPGTPSGQAMIEQIVAHMASHLEPFKSTALEQARGILLSWGYAHQVVRTGPDIVGGLSGIATEMTKDQAAFSEDLRGKDIGAVFADELERQLGWSRPLAIANDTIMALFYFLGPRWRKSHHRAGLFISGTGSNFALAEPYAVRAAGYLSRDGESYEPRLLKMNEEPGPAESLEEFFVNYESGSIELGATRTRFDVDPEYPIERNAIAGGKAFPQALRSLTETFLSSELYARIVELCGPEPGGPVVGSLVSGALDGLEIDRGEQSALRLVSKTITDRSALHVALVLYAVTLRRGFGTGGTNGKPDLVGMEGSIWRIPGYADRVKTWWQALSDPRQLRVELRSEPSFNASLPGPLYLAALSR